MSPHDKYLALPMPNSNMAVILNHISRHMWWTGMELFEALVNDRPWMDNYHTFTVQLTHLNNRGFLEIRKLPASYAPDRGGKAPQQYRLSAEGVTVRVLPRRGRRMSGPVPQRLAA